MSFSLKNTPPAYQPSPYDTTEKKKELQELIAHYRQQLEIQWDDVKDDTLHYGKQVLIIGGVVAGVFLAMNALLPEEKEKYKDELNNREAVSDEATTPAPASHEVNEESKSSIMSSAVKSMVMALALRWARKKLINFL